MRRALVLLVVQTATLLAIIACVLVLAVRNPWRLDLTPERSFTLSPYTHDVLRRLRAPVDITVFYSSQEGAIRRAMSDLLSLYRDASPQVRLHMLDLDRSPGAAERLGVSDYNVAVVEAPRESGIRRTQIDLVNEDTVTAALLEVAGMPTLTAYFIGGHGERDVRNADDRLGAGEAARALAAEGFTVERLTGAAHIPADADLVVLAGATRDLRPPEVDALFSWVQNGGHLLVFADPGSPPSVDGLLKRFGVELGDDLVVDDQARLFGTDGLAARIAYLNQQLVPREPAAEALLPLAQSLRLTDVPGMQGEYLAVTGEQTWADVDKRTGGGAAPFRAGVDRRGPLPVGAVVTVERGEQPPGRLVVLGDADFMTNLHLSVLGNRDLLGLLASLTARDQLVTAPRRRPSAGGVFSGLALTTREARIVFWVAVAGPALLFALAGVVAVRRGARA